MGHDDRTFMRHHDLGERHAAMHILVRAERRRGYLSSSEHDLLRRLVLAAIVGEALANRMLEQARSVIARCDQPDPADPSYAARPLDLIGKRHGPTGPSSAKRPERRLQIATVRKLVFVAMVGVLATLCGWLLVTRWLLLPPPPPTAAASAASTAPAPNEDAAFPTCKGSRYFDVSLARAGQRDNLFLLQEQTLVGGGAIYARARIPETVQPQVVSPPGCSSVAPPATTIPSRRCRAAPWRRRARGLSWEAKTGTPSPRPLG
jgi:hypothetical protein